MGERWRNPEHNGKMKALFLHASPEKTIEDMQQIAKKEAMQIGFKEKSLLRIRHIQYLPQLGGYVVVVQSRW